MDFKIACHLDHQRGDLYMSPNFKVDVADCRNLYWNLVGIQSLAYHCDQNNSVDSCVSEQSISVAAYA